MNLRQFNRLRTHSQDTGGQNTPEQGTNRKLVLGTGWARLGHSGQNGRKMFRVEGDVALHHACR